MEDLEIIFSKLNIYNTEYDELIKVNKIVNSNIIPLSTYKYIYILYKKYLNEINFDKNYYKDVDNTFLNILNIIYVNINEYINNYKNIDNNQKLNISRTVFSNIIYLISYDKINKDINNLII